MADFDSFCGRSDIGHDYWGFNDGPAEEVMAEEEKMNKIKKSMKRQMKLYLDRLFYQCHKMSKQASFSNSCQVCSWKNNCKEFKDAICRLIEQKPEGIPIFNEEGYSNEEEKNG